MTSSINPQYISFSDGLHLYKISEYSVIVGDPKKTTALCTVWQDARTTINRLPELKKDFSIIGNLRSPFGINIMLYNLALNPQIKNIIVWGSDKLSNTDIGIIGKKTLLSLWQNGINKKGQIERTPFKLVEEIDLDIVDKILKNVVLIDQSDQKNLKIDMSYNTKIDPYMKKIVFPEIVVKSPEVFPSETYTYTIREKKGADTYLSLLYTIFKYGEKTQIDTGGEDVKEIKGATVVIEDENNNKLNLPKWIIQAKSLAITKQSLENYYKNQFCADLYRKEIFDNVYVFEKPIDYSYLYSELMYALPRLKIIDDAVWRIFNNENYNAAKDYLLTNCQIDKKKAIKLIKKIEGKISENKKRIEIMLEGLIPPIDQIAYVIDRIKRKPLDLDKEVVLWDVRRDTRLESGRPCINKLSFSVRNGKINVHVFARSHDIGRAWFFNFYGVFKLLRKIAKETNYVPGIIVIESESAHIYKRDWNMIEDLVLKEVQNKKPRMYFDPYLDSDPRGIINISIADKNIMLKLQDVKTGKVLFELDAKTAREAIYKIKHYNFISRPDHAAFIGTELAKAEICIKLNIPYKYDTPIKLPSNEIINS